MLERIFCQNRYRLHYKKEGGVMYSRFFLVNVTVEE